MYIYIYIYTYIYIYRERERDSCICLHEVITRVAGGHDPAPQRAFSNELLESPRELATYCGRLYVNVELNKRDMLQAPLILENTKHNHFQC